MKLKVKMTDMQWYKKPTTDSRQFNVPDSEFESAFPHLVMTQEVQDRLQDLGIAIAAFLKREPDGEIRITRG